LAKPCGCRRRQVNHNWWGRASTEDILATDWRQFFSHSGWYFANRHGYRRLQQAGSGDTVVIISSRNTRLIAVRESPIGEWAEAWILITTPQGTTARNIRALAQGRITKFLEDRSHSLY